MLNKINRIMWFKRSERILVFVFTSMPMQRNCKNGHLTKQFYTHDGKHFVIERKV